MTTIRNFTDVHDALRPYYDYSRTPYTLDAARELLAYLGNPQEKIAVVHIAGTSGKTSTSYYCSALLVASGKTAGLFVSPHVDEVNERLQINGEVLPEAEYCAVLEEFLGLLEGAPVKPSYFELVVAMAYWYFAKQGLDYAVMEVGLGGLLDATNIVERSDKVCVITDIGLDHTEILGDTLAEIATQKAGIVQPGNQVFMYTQSDEVMASVEKAVTAASGARLEQLAPSAQLQIDNLPVFQGRNLGLASAAIDHVLQRDTGYALTDEAVQHASRVTVPARLERFTVHDKTIMVDGSHNQQKIETLFQSIDQLYPDQPLAILCAFVSGNDERWQSALQLLKDHATQLIFTTFHGEQDVPKTSITAQQFTDYCDSIGFMNYEVAIDPSEAFDLLLQRPEQLLLITGSFYLLNHVRPLIRANA